MINTLYYSEYPMTFVDLFTEYGIDVKKDFTKSEINELRNCAVNYINENPTRNDLVVNLKQVAVVISGIDEAGNFITAINV